MDVNADLGESFGRWTPGDDAGLMPHITSANVAAGFHGGDPHDEAVELDRELAAALS